jgi:hypothetical protein
MEEKLWSVEVTKYVGLGRSFICNVGLESDLERAGTGL